MVYVIGGLCVGDICVLKNTVLTDFLLVGKIASRSSHGLKVFLFLLIDIKVYFISNLVVRRTIFIGSARPNDSEFINLTIVFNMIKKKSIGSGLMVKFSTSNRLKFGFVFCHPTRNGLNSQPSRGTVSVSPGTAIEL